MDKLKFGLFSIVILTLVGLLGYWAVITLQSGTEHETNQKIEQLQEENNSLKEETEKQKSELGTLQAELDEIIKKESEAQAKISEPELVKISKERQDLVNELQKLITSNVFMKLKSNGTRVGTVQKFLNIYNNTSLVVDNDYGESTKKAIILFQKAEGLTADGEAGPSTFKKMIDWLKTK